MSNFTRSIVYSGVVLAAGLVAIFAIYNNIDDNSASGLASIQPAAGNVGEAFTDTYDSAVSAIEQASSEVDMEMDATVEAEEAVEDINAEADAVVESVEEATEEAVEDAETVVEEATEAAEDAAEQAETAVEEATEAVEDAAGTEAEVEGEVTH